MELTGQIAEANRQMVANQVLNEFLDQGTEFLRAGDIEGTMQILYVTHSKFKKYGIDIRKFLEEGKA